MPRVDQYITARQVVEREIEREGVADGVWERRGEWGGMPCGDFGGDLGTGEFGGAAARPGFVGAGEGEVDDEQEKAGFDGVVIDVGGGEVERGCKGVAKGLERVEKRFRGHGGEGERGAGALSSLCCWVVTAKRGVG